MIQYRYETSKLVKEYGLGLIGIAATAGPNLYVEQILTPIAWVFWALFAIFLVHLAKTLIRHKTIIEFNDNGVVSIGPFSKREISWHALESVRLSCFRSPRARAGTEVMTLYLRGNGTKIVVESSLSSFDTVLESVAKMCVGREVSMDLTTRHNFEALEIPVAPTK